MELEDVFNESQDHPPTLYEGKFAKTPASVDVLAQVLVPAIDSTHAYPAPWSPRVLEDGTVDMPTKDDLCLVGFATAGEDGNVNAWVIEWWPYSS